MPFLANEAPLVNLFNRRYRDINMKLIVENREDKTRVRELFSAELKSMVMAGGSGENGTHVDIIELMASDPLRSSL